MKTRISIGLRTLLLFATLLPAGTGRAQVPAIGAQVIIEPGQPAEQVEDWFRILHDCGMTCCRIRMFETYMRTPDGGWDFTLFDRAFDVAEKYGIEIFATLFPAAEGNSIGGFKFPVSDRHEQQIAAYIDAVVGYFRSHPALLGWVLVNEPGTGGGIPRTAYSEAKFAAWKMEHPQETCNAKGYPRLVDFDRKKFLLTYNTHYLAWIARRVEQLDPGRHIHVNNHQIFENAAEYDFPAWRSFLTSLGASAHASWHFGFFDRSRYTAALSANCDIIRSGAGPLPFWITELQAGNNTYSGSKAFCPTAEEITQWLWTGIGCGAEGIIFWSLNSRSIGEEAGEWALLTLRNGLSDRAEASREVAGCLKTNAPLFDGAKAVESPVAVLYTRQSLWIEKQVQYGDRNDLRYEGRLPGGAMKSAVALYEILAENGIKSRFGEIGEYDWGQDDCSGQCVILAGQIALPAAYYDKIRGFVARGGKLIVEGASAFYDEDMFSLHNTGFPLEDVFGGGLDELKCTPGDYRVELDGREFPVHLWDGFVHDDATGNTVRILRHAYDRGSVTWMPSMLGLGAIRTGDKEPLSDLLRNELDGIADTLPFIFRKRCEGTIMQTLRTRKGYATVLINKSGRPQKAELVTKCTSPSVIFGNSRALRGRDVMIQPEETLVIAWK